MLLKEDPRLGQILEEMRAQVKYSHNDAEEAHGKADDLLVKAARICGVPRSIIETYLEVEKWYA